MKIAVIVPVHNQQRFLENCLSSVSKAMKSSPCPVSVVCIDDGSTDRSGAILDEYASGDRRFLVLHQQCLGVSAARNAGLERVLVDTQVSHIMFLDSDDEYCPEIFDRIASVSGKADIVEYDFELVREDGSGIGRCRNKGTGVSGRCFSRRVVETVRFFTGSSVAEDVAFNLEIEYVHHPSVVRVGDALYRYRQVLTSEMHRKLGVGDFVMRTRLLEYLVSVCSKDVKRLRRLAQTEMFDLLKQFYRQLDRVADSDRNAARRVFFDECEVLRRRGLILPRRSVIRDLKYFLMFFFQTAGGD